MALRSGARCGPIHDAEPVAARVRCLGIVEQVNLDSHVIALVEAADLTCGPYAVLCAFVLQCPALSIVASHGPPVDECLLYLGMLRARR